MSAQAKQFHSWATEVNYPLSLGGLPSNAILDIRAFTRIPPLGALTLISITSTGIGIGLTIHAHFSLVVDDPDIGIIEFDVPVPASSLYDYLGNEVEFTSAEVFDSPWMPMAGFLLAGIQVTFGAGIISQVGWTGSIGVEPALLADLSNWGLYRLRVRRTDEFGVSSLVDVGGSISISDGYNVSALPDPSNNRLLFDVERGIGLGIHDIGWPYETPQGGCSGLVRTIDGANPDTNGIMEFVGEGGVEVLSDTSNHKLTIRVSRVSQTGTKCPT